MRVFIGYDQKEDAAYQVAVHSCISRASERVEVFPLVREKLVSQGLFTRPTDNRRGRYDLISGAPCSTDFALTRFLVPFLGQQGFVLFTDCDVVFLDDVAKLFHYADPHYAVQVVKHLYLPATATKMQGEVQTAYYRKNWSSVILWNCDHPANQRLSLNDVNSRTGKELHQFYWLHREEIGNLPAEWNWLVGEQPVPALPKLAHFTLGGPWLPEWIEQEHDNLWIGEQKKHLNSLQNPKN